VRVPSPLGREFYLRDAVAVAQDLLGKTLVHVTEGFALSGLIVETEAYAGREDAACHAYKREGPSGGHRTDVMFGPGGYAYVYLIYGMYDCFNVVANSPGEPEAVLIRAVEPREGIEEMRRRRGTRDVKKLCGGPGRLCVALGITRAHYGADLCAAGVGVPNGAGTLFIAEGELVPKGRILATPRINVDYAGEAARYPYRFVIQDSPFLSVSKGGKS
jgi:DNA-3-methyladenine glycosylase